MDGLFSPTDPVRVIRADSLSRLKRMPEGVFDAVVSDPPYGLEFMGKEWDGADGFRRSLNPNDADRNSVFGRASRKAPEYRAGSLFQEWCYAWGVELLRTLKPGGYATVFGGTRTYHRLACALEDAGFEVRDCLMWLYGSGFPKHKACLKPAYEPILLCRRPGPKSLPLGIDDCRVPMNGEVVHTPKSDPSKRSGVVGTDMGISRAEKSRFNDAQAESVERTNSLGRYPANVLHDGSDEVLKAFAAFGEKGGGDRRGRLSGRRTGGFANVGADKGSREPNATVYADTGSVSRFFYTAKASRREKETGLDNLEIISIKGEEVTDHVEGVVSWVSEGREVKLRVDTERSPPRVIAGFGVSDKSASEWSTFLFGKNTTDRSPLASKFTTKTWTNSTTSSATLSWLIRSPTSAFTVDAKFGRESGGNPAGNAGSTNPSLTITTARRGCLPGAKRAASGTRLIISGNVQSPASHPTVKPVNLMRWLVRLVCPKGGIVLDPFAGSGTTGVACVKEGRRCLLIEKNREYAEIARARVAKAVRVKRQKPDLGVA